MLTLQSLESAGGLTNGKPVKRTISFKTPDGDVEGDIWVRQLMVSDYMSGLSDETNQIKRITRIVSNYILLGEDAGEQISEEDAERMSPSLLNAMITAFNEVNGVGDEKN